MASNTYMPRREDEQVAWAGNFGSKIAGDAGYGIPEVMSTAFGVITATLQAAWSEASNPTTRTRGNVAAKNDALRAMKAAASAMVSIIHGTPDVTAQMLIDAGLTVRKAARRPAAAVLQKPFIKVTKVDGRTVTIELRQDSSRRAKPQGVASATVLTATGPVCPLSMDGFTYLAATSRTTLTIPFPASETGDTVWVTAFWSTATQATGPAATPVSVSLPAGAQLVAGTAEEPVRMRVAA